MKVLAIFLLATQVAAEQMHISNKYETSSKSQYQIYEEFRNKIKAKDISNDAAQLEKCYDPELGLTFREMLDDGIFTHLQTEGELCTGDRCVCHFDTSKTYDNPLSNGSDIQATFCAAPTLCGRAWTREDDSDSASPDPTTGELPMVTNNISYCMAMRTEKEGKGMETLDKLYPYKENNQVKDFWGVGSNNGTYGIEGAGCKVVDSVGKTGYNYPVTECCARVLERVKCPDNITFATFIYNEPTNQCCYLAGVNKNKVHLSYDSNGNLDKTDWDKDAAGNPVAPGGHRTKTTTLASSLAEE